VGNATTVTVPSDRVLRVARVSCPDGTCRIRKITIRYNVRGGIYGGHGSAPEVVRAGESVIVRSTVPPNVARMLRTGPRTGSVSASIVVGSSTGTRTDGYVRTGLRG